MARQKTLKGKNDVKDNILTHTPYTAYRSLNGIIQFISVNGKLLWDGNRYDNSVHQFQQLLLHYNRYS